MTQRSTQQQRLILALMVAAVVWCLPDAQAAPRYKQPAPASSTELLTDGLDDLLKPAPQRDAKPAPKFAPDQKLLNDLIEDSLNGEEPAPDWGGRI